MGQFHAFHDKLWHYPILRDTGTLMAGADCAFQPDPPLRTRRDYTTRAPIVLLTVLSVTAGCADIIGFLDFNHLFTAHITGNLVILAAHFVIGGDAEIAQMLSVPIFVVILSLTVILARWLESVGRSSLPPLLLLQFLFLAGSLAVCFAAGSRMDPVAPGAIAAGMLVVSAMAVQNALVQISLPGAPATAVMTSNVTRFAVDIGTLLRGADPIDRAKAHSRVARTLPVIIGFTLGCGLGAACEAAMGLRALALPVGLALIAFAMGFGLQSDELKR